MYLYPSLFSPSFPLIFLFFLFSFSLLFSILIAYLACLLYLFSPFLTEFTDINPVKYVSVQTLIDKFSHNSDTKFSIFIDLVRLASSLKFLRDTLTGFCYLS